MGSPLQTLFLWLTRRVCGLTLVLTVILSIRVIANEATLSRELSPDSNLKLIRASSIWTSVFAFYSLFWHALTAVFYMRVCWALVDVTSSLAAGLVNDDSDTAVQKYGRVSERDGIVHAIVIPNYKEEMQTLRETLIVLASHSRARQSYDVYLAMEGREADASSKASSLVDSFSARFRSLSYTLHPPDIPGEHPSKGSNVAWAVRKLSERYDVSIRKYVIVTIADSDTLFSPRHFRSLTDLHRSHPKTASTTIYPAPMIFDRNADQISGPVRLTDIFWTGIALSGYHRGSVIAPTFSAYSIPLVLIDRAGGWDVDGESMGEDIHIFIKCFFALNGNLNVKIVRCAFSSVNAVGDGTMGGDMKASHEKLDPPDWIRLLLLWHRLLELYLMPVSLCMTIANFLLLSIWQGEPPTHLRWIFTMCSILGAAGIFGLFGNIFFYSRYHELCVHSREEEMRQAGLLNMTRFSRRSPWADLSDLCFAPIVVVVYGVLPTVHATMMHFWTLNLNWVVTKKHPDTKEAKED
ncbi:hypothetical protein CC79DRAFT_1364355 [Sarocladium strictum]